MCLNMRQKQFIVIGVLVLITAFILACQATNLAFNQQNPDEVQTFAWQTVYVILTQDAAQMLITPGDNTPSSVPVVVSPSGQVEITDFPVSPMIGSGTNTPEVIFSPTPSETPMPEETIFPTGTPLPTDTPIPTNTPVVCDRFTFIKDVTAPDGTYFYTETGFLKTWRLKNSGSCTWTTEYDLVFKSGERMSGEKVNPLPRSVPPGDTIDLSVNLEAPPNSGDYTGYWTLRNASNVLFGKGEKLFSVKIIVIDPHTFSGRFSFTDDPCLAEWSNNAGYVGCPGKKGDSNGFVYYSEDFKIENDYNEDEPTLIMHPKSTTDGYIRGKFPWFKVKSGNNFTAQIGCLYDEKSCNARFQLDYQLSDGSIHTLKSWNEKYDGKYSHISASLNSLAGKTVRFILTVKANGSAADDTVFWLLPVINK
jgi:hypothetical protein